MSGLRSLLSHTSLAPCRGPRSFSAPKCAPRWVKSQATFTHHSHTHLDEVIEEMILNKHMLSKDSETTGQGHPRAGNLSLEERVFLGSGARHAVCSLRESDDPAVCLGSLRERVMNKGNAFLALHEASLFDTISILCLLSEDIRILQPLRIAVFQPVLPSTNSTSHPSPRTQLLFIKTVAIEKLQHHHQRQPVPLTEAHRKSDPQIQSEPQQHHEPSPLQVHGADRQSVAAVAARRLRENGWAEMYSTGSSHDLATALSALELLRQSVRDELGRDVLVALDLKFDKLPEPQSLDEDSGCGHAVVCFKIFTEHHTQ